MAYFAIGMALHAEGSYEDVMGLKRDAEDQVATNGVQIDRPIQPLVVELSDDIVDCCVAAFDDHRNPALEAGRVKASVKPKEY